MEEAYAQALWTMTEKGMKPKEAVSALHTSLKARGREALLPRISRAFSRIVERKRAAEGLTLIVARKEDEARAKRDAKEFVGSNEVAMKVDDSLIGGWRLEGNESLVDASFKKQLLALYNRATRN